MAKPNNNVVVLFQCEDESQMLRVMDAIKNVTVGLLLEGVSVHMQRGEDE